MDHGITGVNLKINRLSSRRALVTLTLSVLILCAKAGLAQTIAGFDLTRTADAAQWQPAHDVSKVEATPQGLRIDISGTDPYIAGGKLDLPKGVQLWVKIRLLSQEGGNAQLFYTEGGPDTREQDSIRFPVRPGVWEDIKAVLPPLGPNSHFRFDPPGSKGYCTVQSIRFESRFTTPTPDWPRTTPPKLQAPLYGMASGDMRLIHGPEVGGFKLVVDGQTMAVGHTHPLIGYRKDGKVRWMDLGKVGAASALRDGAALVVTTVATDEDGGRWEIVQTFADTRVRGTLGVSVKCSVNQPREVLFFPFLILLAGTGSFGEAKGQAVFPGLEYLDKQASEVSSSEADIIGPGARRRVPDAAKITIPMMAIQANDRYVGLAWQPNPRLSAMFDSPDRTFNEKGHVMALLAPGSNGLNRDEGSEIPYEPELLEPGKFLEMKGLILGGKGSSIQPALKMYVNNIPMPKQPESGILIRNYISLAAAGWLDSKIREGDLFHHAWPGPYRAQPAADAAVWMHWLAANTTAPGADTKLAPKLMAASAAALAKVSPELYAYSAVGHIRYPAGALLYGRIDESVEHARRLARNLLSRFDANGSVTYHKSPEGLDYGKTHFSQEANGLTAQLVYAELQAASYCGDPELIAQGIKLLHGLDKFINTVPRGAQTWEVPLHTPDILASAYLLRAYTLGYELTGDETLLENARYWAWSGVPFVYLVNPTNQPIGVYSTIPVFGATQWVAPNWMGLPVQWCGLVYADALYRFERYDSYMKWKPIADGITASGLQQTWPAGKDSDRVGLLPDSFALKPQMRNDSAINPATLLACAQRLYNRPLVYDYRVFRDFNPADGKAVQPLIVHAPGEVVEVGQKPGKIVFKVKGWSEGKYRVLVTGLKSEPRVVLNGKPAVIAAPSEWEPKEGRLVLMVTGQPSIELYSK